MHSSHEYFSLKIYKFFVKMIFSYCKSHKIILKSHHQRCPHQRILLIDLIISYNKANIILMMALAITFVAILINSVMTRTAWLLSTFPLTISRISSISCLYLFLNLMLAHRLIWFLSCSRTLLRSVSRMHAEQAHNDGDH